MEKGNEIAQGGAAIATGAAAGVATGAAAAGTGAAVSGTGVSTTATAAGPGPNVNATKPRSPVSGSITNPDGSTTSWTKGVDGVTTITETDANGNVTSTTTHTKNEDGTTTTTHTDADGNVDRETYGSYMRGHNADGTTTDMYQDGFGNRVTDQVGADGNITSTKYEGPEGSGQIEFNPDGSGTETWTTPGGGSGTMEFDADGNAIRGESTDPRSGETWKRTQQDNGDYHETYEVDSDTWGGDYASTSTRSTAPDSTVTETSQVTVDGESIEAATTTMRPDGTKITESTGGPWFGSGTTTMTTSPDGSVVESTIYDDGRVRTTTRGPGDSSWGGKTTWTDAQGNPIEDPYKVDLGDIDFGDWKLGDSTD